MTEVLVTANPARLVIPAGGQAVAVIVVQNRSEEVGHYWLAVEGGQSGWAQVQPTQVSAFPLQATQAQVMVRIPPGTAGAVYHLTVRATSQERQTVQGAALLDVEVPAAVRVAPPPPPPPPAAEPSLQAAAQIEMNVQPVKEGAPPPPAMQWRLLLRNAGAVLDTFSFSVAGIRPGWVRFDPPEVTLKPGEAGQSVLMVTPPADTAPGAYPFTLRAFSHLNLNQRTEIALRVELRPRAGFKVSIAPREVETQGGRDFKVTLSSEPTANADLQLDLSAGDQDDACEYTFDPATIFLPARQSAVASLRVRPRRVLGANERKQITFTVTAVDRAGLTPAQSDSARLIQVGATPLALSVRPKVQTAELEADYAVLVINPATIETTLSFSAEDPEALCDFTFQPAQLTLGPTSDGEVKLHVRARLYNEESAAKALPFTVQATRAGELTAAARAEATLNQKPVNPIKAALIPPQQSQKGEAHYSLRLNNMRPNAVQLLLEAQDPADALQFDLRPAMMALPAGAEGLARLTVKPKDKLGPADGPRRVHQFVVTVQVAGSVSATTVNGVLAQTRGAQVGRLLGQLARGLLYVLRWVVFLAVIFFLASLLFQGLGVIACFNPRAAGTLEGVLSQPLIGRLFLFGPAAAPARAVMRLLVDLVGAFIQLPPSACP